jgi:hypothetical protein
MFDMGKAILGWKLLISVRRASQTGIITIKTYAIILSDGVELGYMS